MAKAAKKKAPSKQKQFLLLQTECGEYEQICIAQHPASGDYSFKTKAGAVQAASEFVNDAMERGDSVGDLLIVEVVDVGKASGVEWTGKNVL